MKRVVVILISIFLFADGVALLVWWTHPQGARKMGFSGKLPFGLEVMLPHQKAAPASVLTAEAPQGSPAFPVDSRGVPQVPDTPSDSPPDPRAAMAAWGIGYTAKAMEEGGNAPDPAPAQGGKDQQPDPANSADGPGGCRGALECRNYCRSPNHWAECLAFCSKNPAKCKSGDSPAETAVRSMEGSAAGPQSNIPISGVRRQGKGQVTVEPWGPPQGQGGGQKAHDPKALGGCQNVEQCATFCSDADNRKKCDDYCAKPENGERCRQAMELMKQRGTMPGPPGGDEGE